MNLRWTFSRTRWTWSKNEIWSRHARPQESLASPGLFPTEIPRSTSWSPAATTNSCPKTNHFECELQPKRKPQSTWKPAWTSHLCTSPTSRFRKKSIYVEKTQLERAVHCTRGKFTTVASNLKWRYCSWFGRQQFRYISLSFSLPLPFAPCPSCSGRSMKDRTQSIPMFFLLSISTPRHEL